MLKTKAPNEDESQHELTVGQVVRLEAAKMLLAHATHVPTVEDLAASTLVLATTILTGQVPAESEQSAQ